MFHEIFVYYGSPDLDGYTQAIEVSWPLFCVLAAVRWNRLLRSGIQHLALWAKLWPWHCTVPVPPTRIDARHQRGCMRLLMTGHKTQPAVCPSLLGSTDRPRPVLRFGLVMARASTDQKGFITGLRHHLHGCPPPRSCTNSSSTYLPTNKQTNQQTNKQTNKQTDRQTDKQTNTI